MKITVKKRGWFQKPQAFENVQEIDFQHGFFSMLLAPDQIVRFPVSEIEEIQQHLDQAQVASAAPSQTYEVGPVDFDPDAFETTLSLRTLQ